MDDNEPLFLFWIRSAWRYLCFGGEILLQAASSPFRWLNCHFVLFLQYLHAYSKHYLLLLGSGIGIGIDAVRDNVQIRLLLQGLPALLVGLAFGTTILVAGLDRFQHPVELYRNKGADSFAGNNLGVAQICYQRLALMGEQEPDQLYRAALVCQAQAEQDAQAADKEFLAGRRDRAIELFEIAWQKSGRATASMSQLAPTDRPGYPPAHVWLAEQLLSRPGDSGIKPAEQHLLHALEAQPDDPAAHALLGQLYLGRKRTELAEAHLRAALPRRPEMHLPLARLYQSTGRLDLARSHAQQGVSFFRKKSEADLDDHASRLGWAAASLLLGDPPTAVAVLEEGLRLTGNPLYRSNLARCYVLWSDAIARAEVEKPKTPQQPASLQKIDARLELLDRAMRYDLTQMQALDRLSQMARSGNPEADEQTRTALRSLLAEGKHQPTIHLMFMIDEQARGNSREARRHFDAACRLVPGMPFTVNNLAWSLAFTTNPRLPQALELIEWAIERQPTELNFRETRGQILAKMGQWHKALPDLQAGFAVRSSDPLLHETLARTYRELGNSARADVHQQKSEFFTRIQQAPRSISRADEVLSFP